MSHVASQMLQGEPSRQSHNSARLGKMRTQSTQFHTESMPHPRRQGNSMAPTLSLLVTPNDNYWDFGSVRHLRQLSPDKPTPISAVDSVFDMPSAVSAQSPNSSIQSPVELEDTSPRVAKSQNRFHFTDKSYQPPQSPPLSARAIEAIKTINIMEVENRRLLQRALAAEDSAKLLSEQNLDLKRKVEFCIEQHQPRPKTAPSPTGGRKVRKKASATTPLSSFNTMMDELDQIASLPAPPAALRPQKSLSPFPPAQPFFPTSFDISPNHFGPQGFIPSRRPPPIPIAKKSSCHSKVSISTPLPGSVIRNDVTYEGVALTNARRTEIVSLEEARKREGSAKPLPPLGPICPSVVKGCVELGCGGNEGGHKGEMKQKKGLGLFWRKR